MKKSLFEQMGVKYDKQGDYLLPCLTVPAEENQPIGIWGQQHKRYLKQHRRITYYNLLTSGKLNRYLADIDQQAKEMFSRLVKQLAEKEGVTEHIKSQDQMLWVGRMNNIRDRVREIVNTELIYS